MEILWYMIVAVGGIGLGVFLASVVMRKAIIKKNSQMVEEAKSEAEVIKKEKILQAKEKFIHLKSEHEKFINERNQKIQAAESRLKQKEDQFKNRQDELVQSQQEARQIRENLSSQLEVVERKQSELDKMHARQVEQLEAISGYSAQDAKQELVESLKGEAHSEAMAHINDIIEEAKDNANTQARKVVINTIQRTATEHAVDNSVSVFNIESDEIKGRIIGREGRNIRALEAATGVEFVVDDTPEAIIISGFDPVRREVARLSLHKLVTDGRIHPARIEEVVAKTQKQIEQEIVEVGKKTCIDLGIHGLNQELVRLIGKMKYRSSYGQNLLQHSREVANLSATMAAELGLNSKLAKRAGLLHDIGKVPDNEPDVPHAILGGKLAEKFNEKPDVVNAIASHHEEAEMKTLLAPIVQACDAISGARPGARREVVEAYINRLKELEEMAARHPGVIKTYAIQAGRELRVIVGADKMSDQEASKLSYEISQKIQTEMTYPGQIKVTVIREHRAIAYAK